MYSSHHRIIKCVGFESIHCIINLNIVLFSRVFNEFDYVFLSNILMVGINEITLISKKKKSEFALALKYCSNDKVRWMIGRFQVESYKNIIFFYHKVDVLKV